MRSNKGNLPSFNHERRSFLKKAGVSAAIIMTSGYHGWSEEKIKKQPLHPGLLLPGVYAYADKQSVEAGNTIKFYISSSGPYSVSLCKLGKLIDDPKGDEVLFEFTAQKAFQQAIYPGSYVFVEKGLEGSYTTFSMQGWVRPFALDKRQTIIAQRELAVLINSSEGCDIMVKGRKYTSPAGLLKKDTWHHWAIIFDGKQLALWVDGLEVNRWQHAEKLFFDATPLTLGASINPSNELAHFLDADLSAISLYTYALSVEQIKQSFQQRGSQNPESKGVLASWNFSEEKGELIKDSTAGNRHGKIINHATWMVGGPSFTKEVERFKAYDPGQDPTRGHGLRLASDDLYNCQWKESLSYKVPENAKPGFYVARIWYTHENKNDFYDVSFIVKRSAKQKKAPLLVLASTNTWRAYNATPFALKPSSAKYSLSTEGGKNHASNPPAYSFYRPHRAGQGTYQVGLRIPWPAAGPYVLYGSDYSHLLRGERYTHLWLDKEGYSYDLITDTDLHKDPGILKHYQAFIINGHSEYWSIAMYQGLENYLQEDGKVIILSGNSLFWRVSYNEDCSILECRKVDAPGNQVPAERRGEAWHSHDSLKGGLLRETPYPGWKLTGLEMLGWINSGLDEQYGPYIVEKEDHFLFNQPQKTGLKNGEAFGLSAGGKLPGANGHEIDIRLSTFKRLQEKPDLSPLPEEPDQITTLASGKIPWKLKGKEGVYSGESFDFYMRKLEQAHQQGAEIIYWERPQGGKVFNAGAIRSGWALYSDSKFAILIKNVLHHYGI